MQRALFLRNKIQRQLQLNGQDLVFVHFKVDEFKQVSNEPENTICVRGLFHTTVSYVKSTDSEGARTVRKPQPMVLVLCEEGKNIQRDDEVVICSSRYKVVAKRDINDFGVVYDISLELIDG